MTKIFTLLLFLFVSVSGFAQPSLPIDFESDSITYEFFDFAGAATLVIDNPQVSGINTSATVAQSIRDGGEVFAGTKLVLAETIDFTNENAFSMKVFSTRAGVPMIFKLEGPGGAAFETQVSNTVANEWETLIWDFTGQPSNTFDAVVLIFDIGAVGDSSANSTFLFDDIEMVDNSGGLSQIDLPVNFDSANVDYVLADFGGNSSSVVVDPTDTSNVVAQTVKTVAAETWAGTSMGPNGFANAIPFAESQTKMTVRVWSPDAGIQVRLKVEKSNDPTISVETEATTTIAMAWDTLEFDFSNEAMGTAAINLANTYNKASIFFNFGTTGADAGEKTYYWDDVEFVGGGGGPAQVDLPVTFDDENVNYDLNDFGGNMSQVLVDPTDTSNLVAQSIKTNIAELWGGTTIGLNGFANSIPFSSTETKMSVRVWSPDAGTPIRLKAEDAANGAISVETEALTTVAMAWDTLEFDFSNEVSGTAALNLANTYNKASIFFNFGTTGADAGEKTYYWDDVLFLTAEGPKQIDLPITFEETDVDFNLADFGGNSSSIETDPTDATNTVAKSIKTAIAELWGGTSMGGDGLANPVPFTAAATKMTVRVWSPDAGTPIRLKAENASNGAIAVETETMTTMAMAWETLEFDFSNNVEGTAALDLANIYDKVSIFFNFGTTGADAGEKTYYWDDVEFVAGEEPKQIDLPITFEETDVDFKLSDFGGNSSSIETDPTDAGNTVVKTTKTTIAELWAGTTMGGDGLANPVPFTESATKMTVRVWSPAAGMPMRLKAEDASNGAISVETETSSTVAMDWETLEFDFSNQVDGTAEINLANTYDKVSIFFNFGMTGADAGELTFFWDDISFGALVGIEILNAADNNVLISPNPASTFVNIEFGEDLKAPAQVLFFDLNGKLMMTELVSERRSEISTDELNSGIYFLRILAGEKNYFQKIIIAK